MQAKYPDREPIEKALRLIIGRQQPNGEWLQEAIEGVFNKSWYVNQTNTHSIFLNIIKWSLLILCYVFTV